MAGLNTRRIVMLSTVMVLSFSVFSMQQTWTTPGAQSTTVNPDSTGIVAEGMGLQRESAAENKDSFLQLTQAPCNPEQEVCNK